MKLHVTCAILALLTSSLFGADQITVEARFIQANARRSIPHDLKKVSESKGFDLLAAPRVKTRSGKPARVEVTRTFHPGIVSPTPHPDIPTGIILHVTPHRTAHGLAYTAQITIREFESVTGQGVAPVTAFTSREIYASGTPKAGEEVWLDFPTRNGKPATVCLVFNLKDARAL